MKRYRERTSALERPDPIGLPTSDQPIATEWKIIAIAHGKSMPHVEVAAAPLRPKIVAILRKVRIGCTGKEAGSIVERFAKGIGSQRRQPICKALLESGLH